MPLKATTTRWDERAHAMVACAAEKCGDISVAQFVRESALIRAALVLSADEIDPAREAMLIRAVSLEVRRLAALDAG